MERELILAIHMKSTDDAQAMNTFETRCSARTTSVPDFVDITDEISAALEESAVRDGRAVVFTADRSCSIMVNEKESGLLADIKKTIARIATGKAEGVQAVVGSSSVVLPVIDGKLKLGTWQRVLLVELEEASERSVDIQIIGQR